jgi:membrane-bound lytic murein transglycosylase B
MMRGLLSIVLAALIGHAHAQSGMPQAAPTTKPAVVVEKHPGMTALARLAAEGDASREASYLKLLDSAVYQQSIIDAISKPAEGKAWKDYRPIFLTQARIDSGVVFWKENYEALAHAEATYQVPANYIVAIIGVETFYGRNVGKYRVLDALTTLGLYYPPRQDFFAGELRQFLQFSQSTAIKLDPEKVVGSYAGAMGLGQFIPTSYVKFAADGNADGLIDLWGNKADITASVAHYFKVHGWQYGKPVVARARVAKTAGAVADMGVLPSTTVHALAKRGYLAKPTPKGDTKASLIVLEGPKGPEHYVSFQNFYVITRYNRSPLYAMAVHELAQEIAKQMAAANGAANSARAPRGLASGHLP